MDPTDPLGAGYDGLTGMGVTDGAYGSSYSAAAPDTSGSTDPGAGYYVDTPSSAPSPPASSGFNFGGLLSGAASIFNAITGAQTAQQVAGLQQAGYGPAVPVSPFAAFTSGSGAGKMALVVGAALLALVILKH